MSWYGLRSGNFNPRSPCGERQPFHMLGGGQLGISIHAPRVGSDLTAALDLAADGRISIHAPRVGSDLATNTRPTAHVKISIHAPRVGSDIREHKIMRVLANFNPRSPCGERL